MTDATAIPSASLRGHVVLVTGASGTLGGAIAAAIENSGGIAIRTDLAGRDGSQHTLDVTQETDWQRIVAEIDATHGRLDGLVNNAGLGTVGDLETTTLEAFRKVQAVNVEGVFLGCKHTAPLLSKATKPSIVNLSSVSGIVAGPGLVAYNASKGAVRMLTKSVALWGARRTPQIRCNSVHPAFIESDMVDGILAISRDREKMRARLTADIPLGRLGQPEEVANTVVFLLSSASSFTTGSEVLVDGGLVAR